MFRLGDQMTDVTVDFEAFLGSWRESVIAGNPSTTELGRRFAQKLVTQWLDASEAGTEIVYCDGAGDGGIDLAVLDVGSDDEADSQSRFLFYMVAINLLKDVMNRHQLRTDNRAVSEALARVLLDDASRDALLGHAIELIDTYFTQGSEESVFEEPAFRNTFNGDLNAFLKSERFGKSMEYTPKLMEGMALTKRGMGRGQAGGPSAREVIAAVLQ